MSLVERGPELALLEGVFIRCRGNRCRISSIRGFPGAGKSELLHAFTEKAAAEGALVLTAIASGTGQGVPLDVLRQLLSCAPAALSPDSALFRCLEPSPGGDPDRPVPAPELSRDALARLRRELHVELARLAGSYPLVIAVDDAQHADPASVECLLYLVRRLRQASLMVVLTESALGRWPDPLVHAELVRQPGYRTIRLTALTDRGVQRVLAEYLDRPVGDELAAGYHRATGGNPLLLRALLDDLRAAPGPAPAGHRDRVVAGVAFRNSVLACVHGGDPALTTVARALAVLDQQCEPALLGQLTELGPAPVAQAVDALAEVGILELGRFRHSAARLAVLGHMPAAERTALHRRAARLLDDHGASATRVAGHLLAAGDTPGPGTVGMLREAAEQAMRSEQPDLAVELLEQAYPACVDAHDRAQVSATLLPVEWRSNPAAAMRHVDALTEAVRAGRADPGPAALLVRSLLWHGRLDEATEVLRRLPTGTGGGAVLGELRDWVRLTFPALAGDRPDPAGPGPAGVPGTAGPPSAVRLLLQVIRRGGDDDSVRQAESLLRRTQLGDRTVDAAEAALFALVCADRPDLAAPWCDRLSAEAATRRAPTWQARLAAVRAEIALRQGDLRAAREHSTAALARLPPRGWGVAAAGPSATLLVANTFTGDLAGAAALLDQPLPAGLLASRYGLGYLHARGWHHLETNRVQEALGDFLACGERAVRWDMDLPALVPWRSGAALANLRLGAPERARQLAEEQLARPGGDRSRTRGSTLVVLARATEPDQRLTLLREAVAHLEDSGDRLEQARALAALSRAYRTRGEHDRAGSVAGRARQLALECGAEPLHRALGRRLEVRQVPDPRSVTAAPMPTTLSGAERRVATLASLGHTNREIAASLYITVSTVEQHLTRVYRKLNVTRRSELSGSLISAS